PRRARPRGSRSVPASTCSSRRMPRVSPPPQGRCCAIRRARGRSREQRARWSRPATGGRIRRLRGGRRGAPAAPHLERAGPAAMSRSVYRRDRGWRLRWAILVAGDVLAAGLAYLLAFALRTRVPLPFTQGYLPVLRFAEVHHHWAEMLLAQVGVLYFLGLYEP